MKNNKKNKGQNLIEFAILLGCIGVGAIFALSAIGFNVNNLFQNGVDQMASYKPFGNVQSNSTTQQPPISNTPGPLGGTPDNPVKQCNGNTCKLDFGEFILDGVPDNFGELVKTSGTAGSTEALLGLVDQLITQMDGKVTIDELNKIKKLSNTGHLIANYEKYVEDFAINCNASVDSYQCLSDFLYNGASTYSVPSSLSSQLPDLNIDIADPGSALEIGGAMNDYLNNTTKFNNHSTTDPAYAFVKSYLDVMDDSVFTDTQKSVIKQLYWQIGSLATEFDNIVWSSGSGNYSTDTYFDPITGQSFEYDVSQFTVNDILSPKYSNVTDMDSALICASGHRSDVNNICH